MAEDIRAHVFRKYAFAYDQATIVVRERRGYDWAYLMRDGTWQTVKEGEMTAEAGFDVPVEAIEAIIEAAEEFLGRRSHASTESAVLREWLAAERSRVDELLNGHKDAPA